MWWPMGQEGLFGAPVSVSQLSCSSHTADGLEGCSDKSTTLFTHSSILFDYFVLI